LDPNVRTPQLWELLNPFPPPRPESYRDDPRIAKTRKFLADMFASERDVPALHRLEVQAPDECHWMMHHGPHQLLRYRGLAYWAWLRSLGHDALKQLYAHYKLQIQHLQLFCRADHWLGKSISHQFFLPVLFDVFPDARVVRLHRHPIDCIPSLANLALRYRHMYYGDRADAAELGNWMLDFFAENTHRMIDAGRNGPAGRYIDVCYEDLIENPVEAVRRIYGQFDCDFSKPFENAIRDYVSRAGATYKSQATYDGDGFALSAAAIIERSAEYMSWLRERDLRKIGTQSRRLI
jgi:hypothetical protein